MWEKLQTLTDMTAGIIPLMLVLFTVALAVIIERLYFFHKVLSQGAAMERELKRAPYRGVDALRAVAGRNTGALQSALVTAALDSQSTDADAMERLTLAVTAGLDLLDGVASDPIFADQRFSPDLYWWCDGELRRLPAGRTPAGPAVMPPDEMVAALLARSRAA